MARPLAPVPVPESELAHYRLLAPNASVRVSPLCLGGMSIGDKWKENMGHMDKETAFGLMDYFYEQGGNFIDTSSNYHNQQSEQWIGEWMETRGNRDRIVLATKFSINSKDLSGEKGPDVNYAGNSIKNLHETFKQSLKNLRTDYIDLLYVHYWDYTWTVEEMMQGLNVFVKQGKLLYLGISDAPAWVVSKANQYAKDHGMKGFSVYQGKYSISTRDLEREVLPMLRAEGMALCSWGSLGGGNYKTAAQLEELKTAQDKGRNWFPGSDKDRAVSVVLEKLAKQLDLSMTGVALAYVMQKSPYIFPIVGGRKIEHLKDNIKAINFKLSDEHIKELESSFEWDVGFPLNFVPEDPFDNWILRNGGYTTYVAKPKPLPYGVRQ